MTGVQTCALPISEYVNSKDLNLTRTFEPHPFVPQGAALDERCEEIFSIQVSGLAQRLVHTKAKSAVIGISGGLDSTLALLVCVKTFDKLGWSRQGIVGVTMPGFGTTDRTYTNAIDLMNSLGVTVREVSIKEACIQHFKDIDHDVHVHDVVYENAQARERTQILMDIANQTWGMEIISVGFRVNSHQGIRFRQWANNVLKEYLLRKKGQVVARFEPTTSFDVIAKAIEEWLNF